MWKNWLIFILGILLILIPFFGFPLLFYRATYVIFGLIISMISFFAARDLHLINVHLNNLPSSHEKDETYIDSSMSELVDETAKDMTSVKRVM